MPQDPHRELTDRRNMHMLGTLTHLGWVGLAVEEARADWYRPTTNLDYLANITSPAERLVEIARMSSGAIDGKARSDLRDALIGSPSQHNSLTIPVVSVNGQPGAPADASGPKPKRLW